MTASSIKQQTKRNNRVMIMAFAGVFAMVGLAYASVPLYDLFCRVTGFGGTTQRVEATQAVDENLLAMAADRPVTVRFDANSTNALGWRFNAPNETVTLKPGEIHQISYTAENISNEGSTGVATFNVTPLKAGVYFVKTQCFCFEEQHLEPGQKVNMPVLFYVDPEIVVDQEMDNVDTITLSYSFFVNE